jgi:hypothetical protein
MPHKQEIAKSAKRLEWVKPVLAKLSAGRAEIGGTVSADGALGS